MNRCLIIENLAVFLCALIGVLSGLGYLRSRKTLFASIYVMGMACIALRRLYQSAWLQMQGSLNETFQVGMLGVNSAFLFFFSANYGQIDSLVDDGGPAVRRYRLMALAGPLVIAGMLVQILTVPARQAFKTGCVIASVMIGAAGYFHVKHLLIPDVKNGVVRCLRAYNALALCLGLSNMLELVALTRGLQGLLIASGALIGILSLLLVPVMVRGVKAWRA